MSKLLERTAALEPSKGTQRTERSSSARTAPGRMFEFTSRLNEAEDRAAAASAEAAEVKKQLEEARQKIESLQQGGQGSPGAIEILIDTLVEVPGRRRVLSPVEYEELRANLAKNKLIHPIVYLPRADGTNEIVSGHNRVAIYRDLGRTTILGIPFSGDAKSAELGATFSNLLAPALPDFEKYRQFVRLQEESGFTRSDILEASGLSASHVSRILAFEKLPAAAREAIARRPDRIGGHAAEEFAAIASSGNAEGVVKAIEALIGDESMTQKRALELAKPKASKPAAPAVRTIFVGKRKLCDVSVRGGVIGLRFNGKNNETVVEDWAGKIEAFIRSQIDATDK